MKRFLLSVLSVLLLFCLIAGSGYSWLMQREAHHNWEVGPGQWFGPAPADLTQRRHPFDYERDIPPLLYFTFSATPEQLATYCRNMGLTSTETVPVVMQNCLEHELKGATLQTLYTRPEPLVVDTNADYAWGCSPLLAQLSDNRCCLYWNSYSSLPPSPKTSPLYPAADTQHHGWHYSSVAIFFTLLLLPLLLTAIPYLLCAVPKWVKATTALLLPPLTCLLWLYIAPMPIYDIFIAELAIVLNIPGAIAIFLGTILNKKDKQNTTKCCHLTSAPADSNTNH